MSDRGCALVLRTLQSCPPTGDAQRSVSCLCAGISDLSGEKRRPEGELPHLASRSCPQANSPRTRRTIALSLAALPHRLQLSLGEGGCRTLAGQGTEVSGTALHIRICDGLWARNERVFGVRGSPHQAAAVHKQPTPPPSSGVPDLILASGEAVFVSKPTRSLYPSLSATAPLCLAGPCLPISFLFRVHSDGHLQVEKREMKDEVFRTDDQATKLDVVRIRGRAHFLD